MFKFAVICATAAAVSQKGTDECKAFLTDGTYDPSGTFASDGIYDCIDSQRHTFAEQKASKAEGGCIRQYFQWEMFDRYPAADRHAQLMEEILKYQVTRPVDYDLEKIFYSDMQPSTCFPVDEMKGQGNDAVDESRLPKDRIKMLHQQGVVAPYRYVSTGDHDYTGLWDTGTEYGILRLSDANFIVDGMPSSNPSMALKALTDAGPNSEHKGWNMNLIVSIAIENQDTLNFFPKDDDGDFKPFTNHPPTPHYPSDDVEEQDCGYRTIVRKIMERGENNPFSMGSNHWARYLDEGMIHSDELIKYPYEFEFRPNGAVVPDRESETEHPIDQLLRTEWDAEDEEGNHEPLFSAWAREQPDSEEWEHIGDVYLTGPLTRSFFGDTRLHFRHEPFNRDVSELNRQATVLYADGDYQGASALWDLADVWKSAANDHQGGEFSKDEGPVLWWNADYVPPMEDVYGGRSDAELKKVVEDGIMGELTPEYSCPFAWMLM